MRRRSWEAHAERDNDEAWCSALVESRKASAMDDKKEFGDHVWWGQWTLPSAGETQPCRCALCNHIAAGWGCTSDVAELLPILESKLLSVALSDTVKVSA